MLTTPMSRRGMVTAPHHLASQAGLSVLRDGGTAIEAAVATAAALAVVYPHMNAIGGDGFWLIAEPGQAPVAIDACGAAGAGVTLDLYRSHGLAAVPWRGPLAAITVAGTISGWQEALALSAGWQAPRPLERLLEEAIFHAEHGVPTPAGLTATLSRKGPELQTQFGFAEVFLPGGTVPTPGTVLRQPALAATLRRLARDGLDGFYRGPLAAAIAADLARAGSPLTAADLARQKALRQAPLSVTVAGATLFNHPPPTQGLASLIILALFDRLEVAEAEGFDHLHGLIEATKQAFLVRDRAVGDPAYMTGDPRTFLTDPALDRMAARIDRRKALAWPQEGAGGDTIWLGVIDGAGRAVSFIQSIYFEFGSGVVLPETGITWQNRGLSFRLADSGWNALKPGRKPFHTLNPALARFTDGRTMVYGTMGGEGQPQTQAAVFTRYARFGQGLQAAVTAPRWLLGRTWGEDSVTLKVESRFDSAVVQALTAAGHAVSVMAPFEQAMGHAGAVVRRPDGVLEGATDPRSEGAVAAW